MRQIITFNDKRNFSKDRQNIRLEILADRLPDCTSFTVDITDATEEQKPNTVTITLEGVDEKPKIYALPQEDDREFVANWFDHIETVASDAPMEYSEKHFSVCDTLEDIMADDNAFRILANAMYSMSGIKITKSMLADMRDKTPLDLASTLGSADNSDAGIKIPENAMQIINAELNKIAKK